MTALAQIRGTRRSELTRFIDTLAADPNQLGDYSKPDDTDRVVQYKIIRKIAIAYRPDHAAREVRIVSIEKAASA